MLDGSIVEVSKCPAGCYGEWVYYDTDEEKKKALEYLELWKYFFLKKTKLSCVDCQFICREKFVPMSLSGDLPGDLVKTLGIKMHCKIEADEKLQ